MEEIAKVQLNPEPKRREKKNGIHRRRKDQI